MSLTEFLSEAELGAIQGFFGFDVLSVPLYFVDIDGRGGAAARITSNLITGTKRIRIDTSDIPHRPRLETLKSIVHEFKHHEQNRRGVFYRAKMWYWRRRYDYDDRPHEIEAHMSEIEFAKRWAASE